jgi:hypothetical protein
MSNGRFNFSATPMRGKYRREIVLEQIGILNGTVTSIRGKKVDEYDRVSAFNYLRNEENQQAILHLPNAFEILKEIQVLERKTVYKGQKNKQILLLDGVNGLRNYVINHNSNCKLKKDGLHNGKPAIDKEILGLFPTKQFGPGLKPMSDSPNKNSWFIKKSQPAPVGKQDPFEAGVTNNPLYSPRSSFAGIVVPTHNGNDTQPIYFAANGKAKQPIAAPINDTTSPGRDLRNPTVAGVTAMQANAEKARKQQDLLSVLKNQNVAINTINAAQKLIDPTTTTLISAVKANDIDAVRKLIELGADIDAKDITGKTALPYARPDVSKKEIRTLLEAEVVFNAINEINNSKQIKSAKLTPEFIEGNYSGLLIRALHSPKALEKVNILLACKDVDSGVRESAIQKALEADKTAPAANVEAVKLLQDKLNEVSFKRDSASRSAEYSSEEELSSDVGSDNSDRDDVSKEEKPQKSTLPESGLSALSRLVESELRKAKNDSSKEKVKELSNAYVSALIGEAKEFGCDEAKIKELEQKFTVTLSKTGKLVRAEKNGQHNFYQDAGKYVRDVERTLKVLHDNNKADISTSQARGALYSESVKRVSGAGTLLAARSELKGRAL